MLLGILGVLIFNGFGYLGMWLGRLFDLVGDI